jgi:hypothetical protein
MWGIWSTADFINYILPPTLQTPIGRIDVGAQLLGPLRVMAIVVVLELILLFRPRGLLGEERVTSTMIEPQEMVSPEPEPELKPAPAPTPTGGDATGDPERKREPQDDAEQEE